MDVSNIDETRLPSEPPEVYVRRLAREKAEAVLPRYHNHQVIVGSDTTVAIGDDILGKPVDLDDARQMLVRLRGITHEVFTGIAVVRVSDGKIWTDVVRTEVPMRAYSAGEVENYIQTGDCLDKAGAYAIQNPYFQPVASMAGCYASVMGLPLCSLSRLLKKAGIEPGANVAQNCQSAIKYDCPVYLSFLSDNPQE